VNSAIYEGKVRHRRFTPVENSFEYGLFMMYLDPDELPTLFDRNTLWSNEGQALARFLRKDHLKHLAPPTQELGEAVRDAVAARTGSRPGTIRLLTHLEYFRYRFNPVSLYYCYSEDHEHVETVITEINNTPWGEQHCYFFQESDNLGPTRKKKFAFSKDFHVSPFMDMDVDYVWHFTEPSERLSVHMENHRGGVKQLDATMTLQRREISSATLNTMLLKYPFMTLKVIAAIHWQAFKLWLKRCPYYPHPKWLVQQSNGA
jgi:DUF1365 family protein